MKFFLGIFIFLFFKKCQPLNKRLNIPYKKDMSTFKNFANTYNKQYKKTYELEKGYVNFKNNIDFINHHNQNTSNSFSLKVNQFADEDPLYLKKDLFSFKIDKKNDTIIENKSKNNFFFSSKVNPYKIPNRLDYREKNVITNVKNQGRCGSCWAFSTVGALEAKYALDNNKLIEFSEQKLVDCSTSNYGCSGGFMHEAFNDLLLKHGLPLEEDYPYVGTKQPCNYLINDKPDFNFLGYQFVLSHSKEALKHALQHNPVCIALAGDPMKFLFYGDGIFDCEECSTTNNHAVLLVGYDTTGPIPYWIIKNSWGKKWGEDGYIRIKMTDGDGILGMNQYGLYPY